MEDNKSFAVIKTGGKQYLVRAGDVIKVEKLIGKKEGSDVVFDEVLLTAKEVGAPLVGGAKVTAKVTSNGKAKKIDVLKYKSKSRYNKRYGHRQPYTEVEITKVA